MGHESTELAHHCARTKVCTRDLGKFRPLAAQELGRAPPAKITQNRPSSESQAREAVATGAAGRAREAARAGCRALCIRREPRSHRQGTRHAPTTTEVAVATTQTTLHDGQSHARGAADEARRRTEQGPRGLAAGHARDGRAGSLVRLLAQSQEAARSTSA